MKKLLCLILISLLLVSSITGAMAMEKNNIFV